MKKFLAACVACLSVHSALFAGGYNINTNQNAAYLRNPARDADIAVDGTYSNPAGVAFLEDGLHASFSWQFAKQERNITSSFAPFAYGIANNGSTSKTFEGEAKAPFVPSLQAAYNWKDWSFQLNLAVVGGGGKCEFGQGLGSFESNVSLLPVLAGQLAPQLGISGYGADMYMKGNSYYYGLTLGAARKLNENLSVYVGVRGIYGSCSYRGYLKNIKVKTADGVQLANEYFSNLASQATDGAAQCTAAAAQYRAAGSEEQAAAYETQAETLQAQAATLTKMERATQDIVLDCDQEGFGVAPIIGVDFKWNKLNLAAKYEFRTRIELENSSVNSEAANSLTSLAKYRDGMKVRDDMPALLTIGAQYEIIQDKLRAMAAYHLYFDKQAEHFGNTQDYLDGNTTEYLLGVEWDICKFLQFSVGGVRTHFDQTDDYLNDVSFSLSSYNIGTGFGIKLTKDLKVNLSYFCSFYEDYTKTTDNYGNLGSMISSLAGETAAQQMIESGKLSGSDKFERKNYSLGVSVVYKF